MKCIENAFNILIQYKMNKIGNKFLLAGGKLMPQMHSKQPGFTYIPCGLLTENKERIQKFTQNELY